ncbi:tyrosine-type recombinase/integrase [Clostridium perfringens]|nr:tyrosine-type recombinase/integrase [Clostridium perfringens]
MTEPIKNMCDIEKIKKYLKVTNKRNYLLFVIGINTTIKSNQILNLKLCDVVDSNKCIREYICIDEKKYTINKAINQALKEFLEEQNLQLDSYLFESQKSRLPINRSHLYRILNNVVKDCNIKIHIGNETLRKTFGYHYYYKTQNIKYLKEVFNKHSTKTLFEYLEIKEIGNTDEFYL